MAAEAVPQLGGGGRSKRPRSGPEMQRAPSETRESLNRMDGLIDNAIIELERLDTLTEYEANRVPNLMLALWVDLNSVMENYELGKLPWRAIHHELRECMARLGWEYGAALPLNEMVTKDPKACIKELRKAKAALEHWGADTDEIPDPAHWNLTEALKRKQQTQSHTPHSKRLKEDCYDPRTAGGTLLCLYDNYPRKEYQERAEHEHAPNIFSWGQRKLLDMEIKFLTLFSQPGDTVVYAGAAPGIHIPFLQRQFFPDLKFILYDPAPFNISDTFLIEIRNRFFTDKDALGFSGRDDILFISDVRRIQEDEELVAEDMENQMRWHLMMQPKASSLKFRLPWVDGTTEYLDGSINLQPYAPERSTETRLFVTRDAGVRPYDHRAYWEMMYYFNTEERVRPHAHGCTHMAIPAPNGGITRKRVLRDDNGDCAAEVSILRMFLDYRTVQAATDKAEERQLIAQLCNRMPPQMKGSKQREWYQWVNEPDEQQEEELSSRQRSNRGEQSAAEEQEDVVPLRRNARRRRSRTQSR